MNALQLAIEQILDKTDIQKLKKASLNLMHHYKEGISLKSEEEMLAYLVIRLPATYAAIHTVLSQLPHMGSILDLGAGPGTVWWAAQAIWNTPILVTAVEREPAFIELGKRLGSQVDWQAADLFSCSFEMHDWVVFGYSLGELAAGRLEEILQKSWQAARQGLVIVEPGTPRGYDRMLAARDFLIQQGGFVLAPCPHSSACPLKEDWCHFSVRLERTFLHRLAKFATLPYEDEKFSYAILTKEKPIHTHSRIIRAPIHRSGHTLLPLCTSSGLHNLTISRRHKELYKKARKSHWGDTFPETL